MKHADAGRRADALLWFSDHGHMADQPLLLRALRDPDAGVRAGAESALWGLWSRSGDPAVDRVMVAGIALMQAGDLDDAVAAFSEVIRRKPGFAEGWNKRATAYFLAGELERSLKDCGEVMKRNPSHFGALSGYGQIYLRLEQHDKALEYWRRALRVNPNMESVRSNIEALEQLQRLRRAKGQVAA